MARSEMSASKIDELEQEIKALSASERDLLLNRLGVLKLGSLLGAEVRIDDYLGRDKDWPRATIRYLDGKAESIDIIKTIEANPVSIGHPVVLHAIRRWERLVQYHHSLSRTKYKPSEDFYHLAVNHLKRLGKALLDGAKERSLPKESVAAVVQALNSNLEYRYLRAAWEILAQRDFKKINRWGFRLKLIETKLKNAANVERLPLLKPIIPLPNCEALMAKLKYLLPIVIPQILAPEIHPNIIAVLIKSNEVLVRTSDGETIKLNLGKVIQSSRLFSVRERKLLAATYGLIECADDIPGVDLFRQDKLDIVLNFLRSDEGSHHLNGRRQSWDAFRSSFDSWRFGLPKSTLRTYRNRAKKRLPRLITTDGRFLVPGWFNEYGLPEIGDWLSFPTVRSDKP